MSAESMTSLLEMLEPIGGLTPDAAAQVAALKVPEGVQARVDVLAQKSNDGTLTPEEHAEYQRLVQYGNMLSVIKARAKKAAANSTAG